MSTAIAKNQIRSSFAFIKSFDATGLKNAVAEALSSVEDARHKCFIAGMKLLELKESVEHGQFDIAVSELLPEITMRTAQAWMRCGQNFLKAIPKPDAIDIEASVVLTTPDKDLPEAARKWKQEQLELWGNKTIREASAGVTVDGDEAHRLDRALNGKLKGGVGKQKDRKAFEKFTATKLDHISTFLCIKKKSGTSGKKQVVGWRKLSPVQQNQICAAFEVFYKSAPQWLLDHNKDCIAMENKLSEAQRLAR
jgi:hypothetical protein